MILIILKIIILASRVNKLCGIIFEFLCMLRFTNDLIVVHVPSISIRFYHKLVLTTVWNIHNRARRMKENPHPLLGIHIDRMQFADFCSGYDMGDTVCHLI